MNQSGVAAQSSRTQRLLTASPFPTEELPLLWEWFLSWADDMIDDHGPQDIEGFLKRHAEHAAAGGKTYAAYVDGADKPIGAVWFDPLGDDIYLGHLCFAPHGTGSREKLDWVRRVLADLFDRGARKVQWAFFADSRAFRLFLRRLGAAHEGLFRQQNRRRGALVDMELMASFPEMIKEGPCR